VEEALRLFKVSTIQAASSGTLAGAEGFTTAQDVEVTRRIEKQLQRRVAIGSLVSVANIMQDFKRQHFDEKVIMLVINNLVRRSAWVFREQRKMIYRLQ